MSAIDDLNTAVANLQAAESAVATEVANLNAAQNDSSVVSATDAINAVTAALQGLVPTAPVVDAPTSEETPAT